MPARSSPMDRCQPPPRSEACSETRCRAPGAERPGQFHRGRGGIRGVHDGDTALAGGVRIDGGVTFAGGCDEFQVRQPFDHGSSQRRAFSHDAHDIEGPQPLHHGVGTRQVIVEYGYLGSRSESRPIGQTQLRLLDSHRARRLLRVVHLGSWVVWVAVSARAFLEPHVVHHTHGIRLVHTHESLRGDPRNRCATISALGWTATLRAVPPSVAGFRGAPWAARWPKILELYLRKRTEVELAKPERMVL